MTCGPQGYGGTLVGSRLKSLEYESLDGRAERSGVGWGDPSHPYIGPFGGGLRDTAISSYLGGATEDGLERRLSAGAGGTR